MNTAIIGLGWWGRMHVDAVHNKSDKIKIRRVVDVNVDGVRDYAAEQDLELTADIQDALDDPDVDSAERFRLDIVFEKIVVALGAVDIGALTALGLGAAE